MDFLSFIFFEGDLEALHNLGSTTRTIIYTSTTKRVRVRVTRVVRPHGGRFRVTTAKLVVYIFDGFMMD